MTDVATTNGRWYQRLPFELTAAHVLRFVLSLAIATILWGWVMQMTDPILTREYRELVIATDGLDDSLMMVTTLPTASVTVQGPESEFGRLNRAELGVHVDMSSINEPGEYQLPVVVTAPDTSADISVEPEQVLVQIDEIMNEVMPISVEHTLPEDDPRTISNIVPDVSQVTVSGPSSAVNRVDEVVLPVSVDNRSTTFSDIYTPYAIDSNGQRVSEVEVRPAQIPTLVEMESRGKEVSLIPNVTGVPAEGFSVQQRAVFPDTVVVDGPSEVLDSLLFVNTEPVSIAGATSSVSVSVGLGDLPEGVRVIEPASGMVEVRVAVVDISSSAQTLSSLPVQPINVPEGYIALVEPRTVSINVDGPSTVLSAMSPGDVHVIVDVEGLEPGTHTVTPQVSLPQGVTWESTSPEDVEVRIAEADDAATPEPAGTAVADMHARIESGWRMARRSLFRSGVEISHRGTVPWGHRKTGPWLTSGTRLSVSC